ncbi:DNA-directed RNA polymerase beta subunit [hydrothermal vent metagenome]|uniref:DNA-directed RNA polymerase n=1 Tax=hydrothermal vent metagenome TaxID=652676 RepID=A0A3B1CFM6_9ZZZZ
MERVLRERLSFGKVPPLLDVPYLIEFQKVSYERFLQKEILPEKRKEAGLQAAFRSVFPISDYNETATIEFIEYAIRKPKFTMRECLHKGVTYGAPLKIKVRLDLYEIDESKNKVLKESREQEVYMGEIPLMTDTGTFIVNGTERVIVSQLHRSPGVFFSPDKTKTHVSGRPLYTSRVIPSRGSWLDFEFDTKDVLYVRIDRRRKIPATIVLKALGYSNEDLLSTFYPSEVIRILGKDKFTRPVSEILAGVKSRFEVKAPDTGDVILKDGSKITKVALRRLANSGIEEIPVAREDIIGRITLRDIIDPETGEIILESNESITEEVLDRLIALKLDSIELLFIDNVRYLPSLRDTIITDKVSSREEALIEIYKKLRPGEPSTVEAAEELFNGLFFDEKRYDLSPVGRLKINKKLGLDIPLETKVLTDRDIIEIVKYLLKLRTGQGEVDDIDHLGNRRVRGVGELLENQFRIGLIRMERAIKEKMTLTELEEVMPHDIINAKPVMAAVKEFFGSSQLSQFMDQTNPLSEITHKRRLSALGPGGLTRERAGFEVRDVHPTHYGRICPIETPEGPNIGLITSLATYARINEYGFIEAPYRKVKNGSVTEEVEYLTAIDGEKYVIAEATTPVGKKGRLVGDAVPTRLAGDFKMVPPEEVQFMDVSPKQVVGVSASLIPFLENDDANRALMGSNMQRQAVPLLTSDAPLVGTGMEGVAAKDSGVVVLARRSGIVESVDSTRIVVRVTEDNDQESDFDLLDPEEGGRVDIYNLMKFARSNQGTCFNQKAIVKQGDRVEKGDVLADGPCTDLGELAPGKNVLVAFMPWGGYNFEDAILLCERLVKDDVYTSIHIEEFEVEARETKLGPEEITRDIPNVGEEALKDLDESGIVRIGAEVNPGDIVVGKVTPKGESQLTSEEKLLRAIFGEKAEDVKDSSLRVPPGISGAVVDVRIFSRKGSKKDLRTKSIEEDEIRELQRDLEESVRISTEEGYLKVRELLVGQKAEDDIRIPKSREVVCGKGKKITAKDLEKIKDESLGKIKVQDPEVQKKIELYIKQIKDYAKQLQSEYDEKVERLRKGDDLSPGVNKLVKVYIAMKRKIQSGDKMAGRHGNKGVIAMVLPEEDMPYLPDGTPVDIVLNPLGVPSRMNVGQILETHLGWAARSLGIHVASPVFEGAKESEVKRLLKKAGLPVSGQVTLCDGRTGESFERPVTVGTMYMMKLHHLVDDKVHARSIGPYSLVTQQPLGGKAQFGGQRLGEMEVWALEAYGAAYTLQEFLTVKSDDVQGRGKMYEAIVKGEASLESGVPESFNVLIKELRSLCLDVEILEKRKKGE